MPLLLFLTVLLAGILLGAVGGWLVATGRRSAEVSRLTIELAREQAGAQAQALAQSAMLDSFRALSADALRDSTAHLLTVAEARLRTAGAEAGADLALRQQAITGLVRPVQEALDRMDRQVSSARSAHDQSVAALQRELWLTRAAATSLATAMRRPTVRGQWGEMQLRRAVEVAGLAEHCDFTEQATVASAERSQRPDLVIHLAGDRHVVVDAKVPLDAFLAAAEASDPAESSRHLVAHARQLRIHADALGARAYWEQFSPSPDFVIMFVPSDAILIPALEADPGLYEHAAARRVLLVTPTTIIAMLRTVGFSWRQQELADSAEALAEAGRELYRRLSGLGSHLTKLGRSLNSSVANFNKTVGSLENHVLPSARRMADLGLSGEPLPAVAPIDTTARPLTRSELGEESGAVVPIIDRHDFAPPDARLRAGPA